MSSFLRKVATGEAWLTKEVHVPETGFLALLLKLALKQPCWAEGKWLIWGPRPERVIKNIGVKNKPVGVAAHRCPFGREVGWDR